MHYLHDYHYTFCYLEHYWFSFFTEPATITPGHWSDMEMPVIGTAAAAAQGEWYGVIVAAAAPSLYRATGLERSPHRGLR